MQFGDASYAIKKHLIQKEQFIELGDVIMDGSLGRSSEAQITVADLTGVAIQDLRIAAAVFETILKQV